MLPNPSSNLDILIVVKNSDIKLLRHFFLSYELFFKGNGNIHLFIWRDDQEYLKEIRCPANLKIHLKDDITELSADDFRNQMYIKLHSDVYTDSEWIWVVDADFLICEPIGIEDFCTDEGIPRWFFTDWHDVPERQWRKPTELLMGSGIPHLFMDEPQYLLNKKILESLRKKINIKKILTQNSPPSEFVAYGAYAFAEFPQFYSWVYASEGSCSHLVYKVNQRPPTYMELDSEVDLNVIGPAKIANFWSHWDLSEKVTQQFLRQAQSRHFGEILRPPAHNVIHISTSIKKLINIGLLAVDGCYKDGWVKMDIAYEILPEHSGVMEFVFSAPHLFEISVNSSSVTSSRSALVRINLKKNKRQKIHIRFGLGVQESSGRFLFSKLSGIKFKNKSLFKMLFSDWGRPVLLTPA